MEVDTDIYYSIYGMLFEKFRPLLADNRDEENDYVKNYFHHDAKQIITLLLDVMELPEMDLSTKDEIVNQLSHQ
jgi:hypothetical protein